MYFMTENSKMLTKYLLNKWKDEEKNVQKTVTYQNCFSTVKATSIMIFSNFIISVYFIRRLSIALQICFVFTL